MAFSRSLLISKHYLGVELSRSAEPNAGSIECIILIESVRLKKDVMEHYNDKGIAIEHIQIKPHNQFKIDLQPRAGIKKKQIPLA